MSFAGPMPLLVGAVGVMAPTFFAKISPKRPCFQVLLIELGLSTLKFMAWALLWLLGENQNHGKVDMSEKPLDGLASTYVDGTKNNDKIDLYKKAYKLNTNNST